MLKHTYGAMLLVVSLTGACDKSTKTSQESASTKPASKTARMTLTSRSEKGLNGTIRIANQSLRVAPFVSHDPHSDLFTNCQKAADDLKKSGQKDATLCYDKTPRQTMTTVRIESYDRKGFEKARTDMAEANESTHFIIRSSGSIYQILDLAYAPRRDGTVRASEIRVLSAFPDKETLLFKELKGYLPNLTMERLDRTSPPLKSRTEKGLNGTIRIANQSLRVAPFVSHDPHSDLFTNCQKAADDLKKSGQKDVTLCYDKTPRQTMTTVRIESYDRKGFEKARAEMAEKNESTHFIIRSSGSIYQVLDLAYATRRDGAVRANEIRVLSAFPDKETMLFTELKGYLPNLTMERLDRTSPPK
jgi:hypothetical protein